MDSLPAEPQRKSKNTTVGSLIPSPADLPDPGLETGSPTLQVDSLPTELSRISRGLYKVRYAKYRQRGQDTELYVQRDHSYGTKQH